MNLRPAEVGDASALAGIANHYIRATTVSFSEVEKTAPDMADTVSARRAAGQGFIVAETDERVLGYATYAPFRAGSGYRETMEHTVMLAPDACGAGVGHALMDALERHARDAGVHSLVGGISAENPGALRFHLMRGFRQVGQVKEAGLKSGRRIDLIFVQKLLSPHQDTN